MRRFDKTVVLAGDSTTEGLPFGSTVERVASTARSSVPAVEPPDPASPILSRKELTRVSQ